MNINTIPTTSKILSHKKSFRITWFSILFGSKQCLVKEYGKGLRFPLLVLNEGLHWMGWQNEFAFQSLRQLPSCSASVSGSKLHVVPHNCHCLGHSARDYSAPPCRVWMVHHSDTHWYPGLFILGITELSGALCVEFVIKGIGHEEQGIGILPLIILWVHHNFWGVIANRGR